MSIQALERVKGPGYLIQPFFKSALALNEFEKKTDLKVAPGGFDGEQVRMYRNLSMFVSWEAVRKAYHLIFFKSAEQDSAGPLRCDQLGCRHYIQIAEVPRL